MTYGISVYDVNLNNIYANNLGLVKVASGTAGITPSISGVTVTYPSSLTKPLLFVRPTAIGAAPFCVSEASNVGFTYVSTGCSIDWVVYAVNVLPIASSGFGMEVYDASGNVIFTGSNPPPNINKVGTIYTTSPASSAWTNNITMSGTARDGGLLYISATSLQPCTIAPAVPQPPMSARLNVGASYTSATNISLSLVHTANIFGVYTYAPLGSTPRTYALIR